MQPLTLSFIQTGTRWHDPAANRDAFAAWFDAVPEDSQLVVLPEMFSTGFSMSAAEIAEPMSGPTVTWLEAEARARNKVICGSLVIEDGGRYYNRFVWAAPGATECYDKRHRFRLAGEHENYAAGRQRLVVDLDGWRICPMICYDLRFPVWFRNRGDYDVLLCVANWPAARRAAWSTLLCARAIENQSYVVGVNILGVDGNGIAYSGDGAVYSPEGHPLIEARDARGVFTVTLDNVALSRYRSSFPAWQDADAFALRDEQA
jgi:predicted amidohydrolase